jgi:hypothetical protein
LRYADIKIDMKNFKVLLVLGFFTGILACSKSNNNDDDPLPKAVDKTANLLATGASGNDILSNSSFDRLLIEIGYVRGFRPTNEAMTAFTDFLRQHTFKETIEIVYSELDSPNEEDLTLQEIADLEEENRTAYNDDSTLAVYIYFADAPSEGDEEDEGLVTLGAVYRNTSMVIHEVTVRKLAAQSGLIFDSDVETATLNHEFGHLFGLVDLGTDMINPHEDPDAQNHCNVQGCLMRAELQFGTPAGKSNLSAAKIAFEDGIDSGCILSGNSVLKMLQSPTGKNVAPPGLDDECILDLQGNGGR